MTAESEMSTTNSSKDVSQTLCYFLCDCRDVFMLVSDICGLIIIQF